MSTRHFWKCRETCDGQCPVQTATWSRWIIPECPEHGLAMREVRPPAAQVKAFLDACHWGLSTT